MEKNNFSLEGKSAFLSGATGYLGGEMALALAKAGAHVFINSRSADKCEALSKRINKLGFHTTPVSFDITQEAQSRHFFLSLENQPLHILINNAYSGVGGTIETSEDESYRNAFEITLIAANRLISLALPNLRAAVSSCGDASVINISSMYAQISPNPDNYKSPNVTNPPFYGAAKAALSQLTRYAACEFGKENIRVNTLSPGPFPSPETMQRNCEFIEVLANRTPLRRVGQAIEIGGPLVFLASHASSYITGATINVDGGWTAW